jgi:hypothetical protein
MGTGQMAIRIRRRQFLARLGSVAATWPLAASAQQSALPVVGFIRGGSADADVPIATALRKGLNEAGYGIPAAYADRDIAEARGLMSYNTDLADMFRQVGVYTGSILKGAKPADLPVLQSTKFEFAINLQTARALGIDVPPAVLSIADEAIE